MSSDFPVPLAGLQIIDYGPDARVVTVTGEVDALTAPTLAACLSAQLAVAQVVVVDLDGLKFLASAGLRVLFEANELAIEQGRHLRLCATAQSPTWHWKQPDCVNTCPSRTTWWTPCGDFDLGDQRFTLIRSPFDLSIAPPIRRSQELMTDPIQYRSTIAVEPESRPAKRAVSSVRDF
jgi:anti-anti-sigma factor